jgi:LemA protein
MNKTLLIVGGVLGVLIILVAVSALSAYNGMVTTSEAVDAQWKQVETQYQRRFDLIPGLVESVKAVMSQEKDVFGKLADARSKYAGASTPSDKAAAATEVESSLSRLLVIMENYPQLKSAETTQTFMAQLEGTENRIAVERKRYNEEARDYNVRIKRFPGSIIANMFGFGEKKYFEAQAGSEVAPKVNFQ